MSDRAMLSDQEYGKLHLPPIEGRHRFHLTFSRFIQAFARTEEHRVLFLDELQWEDAGSLELLEFLATAPDISHMLLKGRGRRRDTKPYPIAPPPGIR